MANAMKTFTSWKSCSSQTSKRNYGLILGLAQIADKSYISQIVKNIRKSRVSRSIQKILIRQFVVGTTTRAAADLVVVNRHMAMLYFRKLRELISQRVAANVHQTKSDK